MSETHQALGLLRLPSSVSCGWQPPSGSLPRYVTSAPTLAVFPESPQNSHFPVHFRPLSGYLTFSDTVYSGLVVVMFIT